MGDGLTAFQVEVARAFFSLPQSAGFLVAGGAALIAQGLVRRTTRDLDFFSGPRPSIADVVAAFEGVAAARGWSCQRLRDAAQFARLEIRGPTESLLVDIGVDSPRHRPPVWCVLGPSYDPVELCGRKLLALFDRAEARDFTDVYALAALYGTGAAYEAASSLDNGLVPDRLAAAIGSIVRFRAVDFPIPPQELPAMLDFFAGWATELRESGRGSGG